MAPKKVFDRIDLDFSAKKKFPKKDFLTIKMNTSMVYDVKLLYKSIYL